MKRSISYWQTIGFIFSAISGTVLHFLFDWTNGSILSSLFSAVNESIWEHMKLLFYPMLLFALVEYLYWGKTQTTFWCIKLTGILFALAMIPVLYYTYTGVLGESADWFNITIFYLAAGAAFCLETKLFQRDFCPIGAGAAIVGLCVILVIFTIFTFSPPQIPLFQDPITGTYGLQRQG